MLHCRAQQAQWFWRPASKAVGEKAQVPPQVEHRKGIAETSTRPSRYEELPCKTWSLRSPDLSGSRVSGLTGMLAPMGIPWNGWFGWTFGSEI